MSRHIYLIAGEASGDFLGAQLIKALRIEEPGIRFSGIGGPLMIEEGLESLFPMSELSLMGIWEIAPKVMHLLKRIRQTVGDIEKKEPDAVVTIDAPDFAFRVQKKLKTRGRASVKQIHYVAPTVWAWRAGRAEHIAEFLDGIICLFHFEPPYFEAEGIRAVAAGHPVMEKAEMEDGQAKPASEGKKTVGLFLGSRQGELKRVAPAILSAAAKIHAQDSATEFVLPTLPHLKAQVETIVKEYDFPAEVISGAEGKWAVMRACDAAIAVSGTVGLELAVADVPHIIGYKMNALTYAMLKRLVKVQYAHLANIICGKEIVPEYIQEECQPAKLALKTLDLLMNEQARQAQKAGFAEMRKKIGGEQKPSAAAAQFILSELRAEEDQPRLSIGT
jgi:lipid-A-disaccharide synthase